MYVMQNHFAEMCISQGQHQRGKKVHAIKQSESENDMFIGQLLTVLI